MRAAVFLICLFICLSIFGQSELKKQLNLLINDSTNRFKSFKSAFKYLSGNDSVFHSAFNLDGTIDNIISVSNDKSTYIMDYYMADIARSIPGKQGRKIADEWKDKIFAIVGNKFQLTSLKSKNYPLDYGWQFERGYFSIDIVYVPGKRNVGSLLLLHVSYLHLRDVK
jgi:hypothetical protein